MISVIIPCYNMSRYVGQTILSVRCQTYDDFECIVVDDCSTDDSMDVIRRFVDNDKRFKTIQMPSNAGVSAARNTGISKAEGEYILCLDADDLLTSQALWEFAEAWEKNKDASLLVPAIHRFGNGEDSVQFRTWAGYEDLKHKCTPTNSSCFKKKDWERVGGYRDGTMFEDWEFWLRLLHNNDKVINIPDVLIEYRVRKDSRYNSTVGRRREEVEIIKKMNPEIFNTK